MCLPEEARRRFLTVVSEDANVVSLLETGRFFEDAGNTARSPVMVLPGVPGRLFGRGSRTMHNFLLVHGEERECEKVMLYILSNVKKNADIGRVASVILDKKGRMYRMKRLMEHLVKKLEERRADVKLGRARTACYCFFHHRNQCTGRDGLCRMQVLLSLRHGCDACAFPVPSSLEDYLQLIRTCKERSVADRPIMNAPQTKKRTVAVPPVTVITDQLGLSEQEQKIVEFLRSHRKASEMDLRKLLGTRRVVGIVNQLIQKASLHGIIDYRKERGWRRWRSL